MPDGKLSKALTNYRPKETCGECQYMIVHDGEDQGECNLVSGTVDPEHVCELFDRGGPG
jgi:hypothetical protein